MDEYQDLLRISVASAGNDHRLGANEAPPAIVSMFIGDELQAILDAIESGEDYTDIAKTKMDLGVSVLPDIPKDTTDRNRTSPFASPATSLSSVCWVLRSTSLARTS